MDVLVVFDQIPGLNLSCQDYTFTVAEDMDYVDSLDEDPDEG